MKKLLCAIALAMSFVAGGPRLGFAETTYVGNLVQDTAVCVDSTYDLNLNTANIDRLSFVATYSSAAWSAATSPTFTPGIKSTASITVNGYADLIATKGALTIAVMSASTTTLRGTGVTINGERFYASPGGEWTPVLTATGNAVALAAVIDASANFDAVAVSTVVYATATVAGVYSNSWAIVTNSTASFRLNAGTSLTSTFTGGRDNARLNVNGVRFTQGTDFTAATSNAVTAKAISDALMANATLAALFTSTWNAGGIVASTANAAGTGAYTLFTSTPNALKLNNSASVFETTFQGGSDSKISSTTDRLTLANHKLKTGCGVYLSTGGGTAPAGLADGTTYYPIVVDGNTVKLATTKANAVAGTAIDITGTGVQGTTYTLNKIGMTGTPSFVWQASNDGTNFVTYTPTAANVTVSSVTWSAAGSTGWDFGYVGYKILRLKYLSPTFGGLDLTASGNGER